LAFGRGVARSGHPDTIGRDDVRRSRPTHSLDLALYTSLLRRHRRLVIVGVVVSLALAVVSFVRVSPSGIAYRANETWVNESTLLVTQAGFREGRSAADESLDIGQRFASLVDLYAALVESDEVVNLLVKRGLVKREDVESGEIPVVATPVVSSSGASTPLMTVSGSASSPGKATVLTVGATKAFIDALERRQDKAGIPRSQRILVQVVRRSSEPQLTKPRSKSLPVIILLAGLSATIAAAFVRENAGRRRRLEGPVSEDIAAIRAKPEPEFEPKLERESTSPAKRRGRAANKPAALTAEDPTPRLAALDTETGSASGDARRGPPGKTRLGTPLPDEGQRRASQR
jgi:capsular polysaccharide biosynthesis protein